MELKDLYALMERFEKSGLSELTIKKSGEEICLKKAVPLQLPPVVGPAHAPAVHAIPAHEAKPRVEPVAAPTPKTEIIRAPLVGTFYRAAAPDAPPFVEKGDTVKKGKPLCILEAMKLMNEFQAEFDLVVVDILVENGGMVEFGMPLFEVRRA